MAQRIPSTTALLDNADRQTLARALERTTTSQAAEVAGISHTHLRNLTDTGAIAVQYRGTLPANPPNGYRAYRAGLRACSAHDLHIRRLQ